MENTTLSHWGIKGQKWGVRRFQTKSGSLTAAGKKRYSKNDIHEDYKRAHSGKNVKYMSDNELKDVNKRLEAENNYKRLTQKAGTGKKAVQTFISTAGTITAAVAAYGTYKTLANKGLDKIGDAIVKSIDFTKPLA